MPVAEVLRLADLVSYQAAAVVSRTLIKGDRGTVTVFAFDAGQALSEHTTPFDALTQILDGEAEITISGKPHRMHSGEAMLLPANQPHAVRAITQCKMILTMIRFKPDGTV